MAATSASSDSATRSTARRAAAAAVSQVETAATNSASCCVDHPGAAAVMSGDRQHDEGLVVEPAHAPGPGDLAVGVEAGDRCAAGAGRHPVDLGLDALLAEDAPPGDAVEHQHADGRAAVEGQERVTAGGVGGVEHRGVVPLHQPHQRPLRDFGDAGQGPFGEVAAPDEPYLLLTGSPPEA